SMISDPGSVRWRADFAGQGVLPTFARAIFSERSNGSFSDASVLVTTAYLGGVPSTWSLSIPDLTAAGFNAAVWGMHSTAPPGWDVGIVGGAPLEQWFVPVEGVTTAESGRWSPPVASAQARPSGRTGLMPLPRTRVKRPPGV